MGKKIHGTWNGRIAFVLDGELFLVIGDNNGWARKGYDTSGFEPYTAADLNEPKHRREVMGRVGGEYRGKYSNGVRK